LVRPVHQRANLPHRKALFDSLTHGLSHAR
jgi:hypothetical protein